MNTDDSFDYNWENNAIQFPRLIYEIAATGAFDLLQPDGQRVIDSIALSMDLDPSEVYELIDRADTEWGLLESKVFNPPRGEGFS